MKNCKNCGYEMEDEDVFCERCGKKFPIEKGKETEVKKEKKESKFSFTPMEVLEIFIAFVAPLGIFIYITRFTESPRYVGIIAGLLVPATIKIRGEKDTSNRKDFRNGLKGIGLILAIILGIGAVGLFLWRSFGNLQDMIDNKPMSVIAITLILILIYLIKLCNKKN